MPKSFLIKNCSPKERPGLDATAQPLDFQVLPSYGQAEIPGVHPASNANILMGLELPHSYNTYNGVQHFHGAPSFALVPALPYTASPLHPNGGVPIFNVHETHFQRQALWQHSNPIYRMEGARELGDGLRDSVAAFPRFARFTPAHANNCASYWRSAEPHDQIQWSGSSTAECGKATIPRTMPHVAPNALNCAPEWTCVPAAVLQDAARHLPLGPAKQLSTDEGARNRLKRKEKSAELVKEERRESEEKHNIEPHQDHHSQGRDDKHASEIPSLVQSQVVRADTIEDWKPPTAMVWYSSSGEWNSKCSDANAHVKSHPSGALGLFIDTGRHRGADGGMVAVKSQSEGAEGETSRSESVDELTSGYHKRDESVLHTRPPATRDDGSSSKVAQNSETPSVTKRTEQTPAKAKPRHQCDDCGQTFTRSSTLTTHKRIHTGEKPYSCEQCGRAFRQHGNLSRHRLTHTTCKPYVCPHCDKAFNRASNLHTHMRTHSDYKPFKCEFCSKRFHQKIDMKMHRHAHTGEKPHKCTKCGRGFKQLTHLTYHLRTHSRERPYKCNICAKGFNQKGNLKAHEYNHTGERPFKCDVCSKGFTLTSTLNTHKRTHAAKKPYQCQLCEKAFYQKSALKTHYVASHPYTNGVLLL